MLTQRCRNAVFVPTCIKKCCSRACRNHVIHQKNLQVYKIAIFAATQRLKLQIVGFAPRSDMVHSSAVCLRTR